MDQAAQSLVIRIRNYPRIDLLSAHQHRAGHSLRGPAADRRDTEAFDEWASRAASNRSPPDFRSPKMEARLPDQPALQ
ncbi:hypothetical protein CCM_07963 [Cordyceps militaris CM01]|uniref:Uncharacterized protein n=1 Tax=Cordyceps militaris (strain CM01) TaxID=983644 RepID=G3JPA1_CORMM|nr:uncharacterized protein CCM_07963 [Cordyceps militaris CM01]EGX89711.1 hypothetical protein CCM_07963 [Cordyceps militaris CM01]